MVRDSATTLERWFFYQDVANLWKWARIDVFGTVLSYSGAAFGTREACVDDARRSGYRDEPARAAAAAPIAADRPTRFQPAPTHRF